jgi:hypothetical protein
MEAQLWHFGWDTANPRASTFSRTSPSSPIHRTIASLPETRGNDPIPRKHRHRPCGSEWAGKTLIFWIFGNRTGTGSDIAEENGIPIASLLDLFASKLKTVQSRAEAKDYRDIWASFDAGLSLAEGWGAAPAIYGKNFNGALSLRALTYFEDGDLPSLTPAI